MRTRVTTEAGCPLVWASARSTVPAAERVDATVALKGKTPVERPCELRITASHAVRRTA